MVSVNAAAVDVLVCCDSNTLLDDAVFFRLLEARQSPEA